LNKLNILDLKLNEFSGSIPETLANLSDLNTLILWGTG
jgi:hypothetical protein